MLTKFDQNVSHMASDCDKFPALTSIFQSNTTLTGPLSTNIATNGRKLPTMSANGILPAKTPHSGRITTKMPPNGKIKATMSEKDSLTSKMPENGTHIPTMAHIPLTLFAAQTTRVALTRPLDLAPEQNSRPRLAYAPYGDDACETLTTKRGKDSASRKRLRPSDDRLLTAINLLFNLTKTINGLTSRALLDSGADKFCFLLTPTYHQPIADNIVRRTREFNARVLRIWPLRTPDMPVLDTAESILPVSAAQALQPMAYLSRTPPIYPTLTTSHTHL